MAERVWISSWQLACCGEDFAVGDVVSWSVQALDHDFLDPVLGSDVGITCAEEHHSPEEPSRQVEGTVTAIQAAHCRYEPRASARAYYPVDGSGRRVEVDRAVKLEEPLIDGLTFMGWIADVSTDGR